MSDQPYRLIAEWTDPRVRSGLVAYRLTTNETSFFIERAERDLRGGTRWTVVGSVSRLEYQGRSDGERQVAGLLGMLAECCAAGAATLTPPQRPVTSG